MLVKVGGRPSIHFLNTGRAGMLGLMLSLFLWADVSMAQSTSVMDSLRKELQRASADSTKARLCNAIAFESTKANYDSMRRYSRLALQYGRSAGRVDQQGQANLLLGNSYYFQGKYDSALDYYHKAASMFRTIDDQGGEAAALNEIGVLHRKQGDLEVSRKRLERALQLSREAGDLPQEANSLNNVGVVYQMMGNHNRALEAFHQSSSIKSKLNDLNGLTYNYNNIGILYAELGQFDSAIHYFKKTVDIRRKLDDRQGIAIAYCNLGEMYNMMGAYDSARTYLLSTLNILKEIDYRDLRKHVYLVMSETYQQQGRYQEAFDYFRKYSALNDSLFNETKSEQLLELETKYNTAEKDRQIAQQELKVRGKNQLIYALVGGLAVLILLSFLIYRNQRQRQKHLRREAQLKEELAHESMLTRVKNERLRISRDLHDNIGAELTLITSALDSKAYQTNSERDREWYNQISDYARNAMTQLRETIWAIKTDGLTLQEFAAKVREFTQKISHLTSVDIAVNNEVKEEIVLTPAQVINLYRVCQEALQNAVKYANTKNIVLTINKDKGWIEIMVADEGIGFNEENITAGYGLDNMRERVKEVNGTCEISSEVGQGTTVNIKVPVRKIT